MLLLILLTVDYESNSSDVTESEKQRAYFLFYIPHLLPRTLTEGRLKYRGRAA